MQIVSNNCPNPHYLYRDSDAKLIKKNCDSYKCDFCRKKKAQKLFAKTKAAIQRIDEPVRHMILTLPLDADDEYIGQLFSKLRSQLWKTDKFDLEEYIWVKEFHEKDWESDPLLPPKHRRHLHVALFKYIPWQQIKKWWPGRVKIKYWDAHRAPSYLSKYLSKADYQHLFKKYEKRYQTSRNFFTKLEKKKENQGFKFYWSFQDLPEEARIAERMQVLEPSSDCPQAVPTLSELIENSVLSFT